MLWRILHPARSVCAVRTYPRDCGPPNGAQKEVRDELMISSDNEEECVEIKSSEFDRQDENDVVHELVSSSTSTADTHLPRRRLRNCFRQFPKGCGPPSRFTTSAADTDDADNDDPEELELVVSSNDEEDCAAADDDDPEELELFVSSDNEEECVEIESSEFESQNEKDVVHEVVSSLSSTRRYCFRQFPEGCGPPSTFTSSASYDDDDASSATYDDDPEELEFVVSSDDEEDCVDFESSIEAELESGDVDETPSQMLPRKRNKINRYQRSQVKKLVRRALNSRFGHRKRSSNTTTGSNKRQRIA